MSDELIRALEARREGYREELAWHRFLFDCYTGAGGFEGREKRPPSETWGAAATIYAAPDSYLTRHPREDDAKYLRRRESAHFPNYVEPLTDLKLSYLLRKRATVDGRPEPIESWREDVDGRGTTFEELRPVVALRAAIFGWCPVLVDLPKPEVDPLTAAQASELGLSPRAIPLLPANVCDWAWSDDGTLEWVKLRSDFRRRDGWNVPAIDVERYTIWDRETFSIFDVTRQNGNPRATPVDVDRAHGFGCVPLTICRHKSSGVAEGVGVPMHGAISIANRALFNYVSQLDEHLAQQAFALLVMVTRASQVAGGEVEVGTDNALSLDPEAGKQHYYLAPPATVAEVLEARIEKTIQEIYRMARVEYQRPTGGEVSGVARAYDFAQTNQALSDFAAELARWEAWIDDVVGRVLGVSEDARRAERITPPTRFDVDDLTVEIKQAIDAVSLKLGPTATAKIKMQTVRRLLPDLTADDEETIESELEEAGLEEQRSAAMADEIVGAMGAAMDPASSPKAPPPAKRDSKPVVDPSADDSPPGD